MTEYHKIQTVFKRDMKNNGKIIYGEYSMPEFFNSYKCDEMNMSENIQPKSDEEEESSK